jgi:hypothetical protein
MAGFANAARWAECKEAGRFHVTTFRKQVASAATVANDFIDYTYFAGNPVANFYASSPLEAAHIEANKGIHLRDVGSSQYVKDFCVMTAASSATATSNQNQRLMVADYLMYYPFIDTDAVGEQQDLVQAVSLPRYATEGGQIMCVAQSAASTVGTFTMSYTNQDGVSGRTTQTTYTKAVAGGGTIVTSSTTAVGGSLPFVGLQEGDAWARSIESVNFSAAGGGLMAAVIVKPIFHTLATQECRRTTTGNLESYGAATHMEALIHMPINEIKQGAVLGVIGLGNAGSLASSILVGVLTTQWSA